MRTIACVILLCLTISIKSQDFETYEQSLMGVESVIEMVPIQAGEVSLGDEKSKEPDEKPVRNVSIPAFWMSSTEITHDIFMVFRDPEIDLDAEGKSRTDGITRPSAPYEDPVFGMGKEGFPAAGMTQFSALQFCKWLSDKTGHFYRLPTEAEWEYACGAGSDQMYFFGKKKKLLKEYGWYDKNSGGSFRKVGQLKPNPWGLYDIIGNVAEWTLDQYDANAYAEIEDGVENPWRKPTALHPRTVRGGSYRDDAIELRSANRTSSTDEWKKRDPQIPKSFWWNTDSPFVGFRIIRPADPPSQEEQNAFWALVLGG